jgi:hypothetical protein
MELHKLALNNYPIFPNTPLTSCKHITRQSTHEHSAALNTDTNYGGICNDAWH